jgi:diacylglycerol kinase family enzyme
MPVRSPSLRVLLVVNSFASSVTARNTVVVHRRLSRDHDVELVETNRRGHATRFAHDAARRGVDVVVGYGGDGTLNEVATGIAGTDSALGVLPGGSTNVFARTIGLPNDPVAAVDVLAGGIDAADFRPIGLGRVNGRFFCFHTGVGFDAAVVAAVEQRASLKRWIGHPLFIAAGVTTWARGYDRRRPHFRLTTAAGGVDGYFSIVLNTNPYTYLGNRPLDLSHAATLDRGLVVITFTTMRATAILGSLLGALRGGGVEPSAHLDEQIDLAHLVIEHDTPFPYQVDGDYLGESDRLEFHHVPDAVKLVVVPGAPATASAPSPTGGPDPGGAAPSTRSPLSRHPFRA